MDIQQAMKEITDIINQVEENGGLPVSEIKIDYDNDLPLDAKPKRKVVSITVGSLYDWQ